MSLRVACVRNQFEQLWRLAISLTNGGGGVGRGPSIGGSGRGPEGEDYNGQYMTSENVIERVKDTDIYLDIRIAR
jgi:hypothetical protein